MMNVYCIEVMPVDARGRHADDPSLSEALRASGLTALQAARVTRLYFLEGRLHRSQAEPVATRLVSDPVTETVRVRGADEPYAPAPGGVELEVHPRPGVMDPVAESTHTELRAEGLEVASVRTGARYRFEGPLSAEDAMLVAKRTLANDCIELVVVGTAGVKPSPQPPVYRFEVRHIALCGLDDAGLEDLSRTGHLFLSLDEMRAIQAHFQAAGREPTDLELETLAQTWSEHCVHKTLRSAVRYEGVGFPEDEAAQVSHRYENLLRDTIVRATETLRAAGRGPECLSVFKDNAGVIGFDADFGIAFKVETHNHPSAIEPYGGAATGIGGCIRDVIGCGLGARPIANTDVFCVAPSTWPRDALPKGVLHPLRVLRGIVKGVADYGNRMGIPTVNGAVVFDPRYLGNPLVYCGCVGLIPRDKVDKRARPGDLIVVIGGRTGRDGIHGATFSSAELTDTHADEFSHAVQIGNSIAEKRFLDAVLLARDAEQGCLYTALTDCGAGGLSSAVGEMGEEVGASVDLERVPLKYAGLRYDEIWISEAQERMVLSVPEENLDALLALMRAEEVEATVIGRFGAGGSTPRLVVRYEGQVVGDMEMAFLHDGLPRREREALWQAPASPAPHTREGAQDVLDRLKLELSRPNAAAKEWIIRQYDHEVQGGSVLKPLVGPGQGPADAAVLRPRLDSARGIAVGCGLAPRLSDIDPYWMAVNAIDEAVRNVVSVGGAPEQTAILDNFCWGRTDDKQQLGALVRACQACHDAALAFGTPFISGKDSLNNEYALDAEDVGPLLEQMRRFADADSGSGSSGPALLEVVADRVRRSRRLAIPGTLLISAVSIVPDVARCVSPDLKHPGADLLLLGAYPVVGGALPRLAAVHTAMGAAMRSGLVTACHDVSEGGWLTALAEMVLSSGLGANVGDADGAHAGPFDECAAGYVVETTRLAELTSLASRFDVPVATLGRVREEAALTVAGGAVSAKDLRRMWAAG